jgi:hypothetical protein
MRSYRCDLRRPVICTAWDECGKPGIHVSSISRAFTGPRYWDGFQVQSGGSAGIEILRANAVPPGFTPIALLRRDTMSRK